MIGQPYETVLESASDSSDLLPYGDLRWRKAAVQTKSPHLSSSPDLSIGEPEYVKPERSSKSAFGEDWLNQNKEVIPVLSNSSFSMPVGGQKIILVFHTIELKSSSTSVLGEDLLAKYTMGSVFELAAGEDFEDGVETEFSRQLEKFVKDYGNVGIFSTRSAILKERFPEPYIAEALLWLGDMEHERTKNGRRLLLENALDSKSVFIRDAAVSGLSYLGDPKSIDRLSEALTEEPSQGIRTNIKTVLKYLRKLAV